jgi:hypothetical protein
MLSLFQKFAALTLCTSFVVAAPALEKRGGFWYVPFPLRSSFQSDFSLGTRMANGSTTASVSPMTFPDIRNSSSEQGLGLMAQRRPNSYLGLPPTTNPQAHLDLPVHLRLTAATPTMGQPLITTKYVTTFV